MVHSNKLNSQNALDFILAGKATFTVKNIVNGNRYTFKVNKARTANNFATPLFFVNIMNGRDNETNYGYIGYLKENVFIHGGLKAKAGLNTPSVICFMHTFNNLLRGFIHPQVEIWHEGKCGKCGRKLTVPESIENGLGPECEKMLKSKRR